MPLLTKMGSLREDGQEQHSVLLQQQIEKVREQTVQDSGYEYFEEYDQEECDDSDMEGSIIHRGRPKKPVKPPVVPQRSEKRASKLLENVMLELQNLDGSRQKEEDKISILHESDPHELYLSSEEDASFSDDYDDSPTDIEEGTSSEDAKATRASSSRASSRKSQEDTARVVSFTSVGKPQIIEINVPNTSPSTANKRITLNLESLTSFHTPTSTPQKSTRRPTPLRLYPALRRMSISSVTSLYSPTHSSTTGDAYAASTTNLSLMSSNTNTSLTPRKSSRLASNLTSLVTNTKNSFHSASQSAHTFLNSDPFATPTSTISTSYIPSSKNTNNNNVGEEREEQTPKTPTRWGSSFLSKARKSSLPKISLAYTAGVVRPRENSEASASKLSLSIPASESEKEKATSEPIETAESDREPLRISTSFPQTSSSLESKKVEAGEKVRYEDIIKGGGELVRSPTSIPTPKERRTAAFGRLVRTKSWKGKGARPQMST
jgi:hypothetical protein